MKLFFRRSAAFLKRDTLEYFSYKTALSLDLMVSFFHLVTFFFIAQLLGDQASAYLKPYGGEYFPFVLIGIVFMGYQNASLYSFVRGLSKEQGERTLESVLLTSTGPFPILCAAAFWDFVFTTCKVLFLLGAACIFFRVDFSTMNGAAVLGMIFLTTASLTGLGLFSAGYLLAFKRGDPVGFFLNGLTKLLAGVYFPIALLPEGLQKAAYLLPFTHSLSGLRKAILLGAPLADMTGEILALLGTAAVTLPLGIFFFQKMFRFAQRQGSLAFS